MNWNEAKKSLGSLLARHWELRMVLKLCLPVAGKYLAATISLFPRLSGCISLACTGQPEETRRLAADCSSWIQPNERLWFWLVRGWLIACNLYTVWIGVRFEHAVPWGPNVLLLLTALFSALNVCCCTYLLLLNQIILSCFHAQVHRVQVLCKLYSLRFCTEFVI